MSGVIGNFGDPALAAFLAAPWDCVSAEWDKVVEMLDGFDFIDDFLGT